MNMQYKRKKWYSMRYVQFELVKAMKNKEVIFMDKDDNWKCVRGLSISTWQYLERMFQLFNFFEKNYNIYISLANYENIPHFTYNLKLRSEETNIWFKESAKKEITGYDILLDFDSEKVENYREMIEEIGKIISLFELEKIPYWIYPSGNNFQIILPSYLMPIKSNIDQHLKEIKEIFTRFKGVFELKYLDLIGLGVYNKISKCPYSLVNDKVVLPLRCYGKMETYITKFFNYEEVDSNTVLKTTQIKNRGICLNNMDSIDNEIESRFRKFLIRYWLL